MVEGISIIRVKLHSKKYTINQMKTLFFFLSFCHFPFSMRKKSRFLLPEKKSRSYFSHEHIAGCKLLAKHFGVCQHQIRSIVITDDGYPKDASVFDGVRSDSRLL